MSHIFISYKSNDKDLVAPIVYQLKRHFRVWQDTSEIQGSDVWREKISKGLDDAVALIVMLTPQSVKSPWVEFEYQQAQNKGITIFPYIIEDVALPSKLQKIQALTHSWSEGYVKLIRKLPSTARIHSPIVISELDETKTFAEHADLYPEEAIYPPLHGVNNAIGLPIFVTDYSKCYLVGRANDTCGFPKNNTIQIGLQLTGRDFSMERRDKVYPQDAFPAGIVVHFLNKQPDYPVRLLLIRGPLNQPYDETNHLSYGLDVTHRAEWEDIVNALIKAQNFFTGELKIQVFTIGPAILTYKWGVNNTQYRDFELFQFDPQSKNYYLVLSS